ncbi:ATP-binding protein [Ferrovibrio xuzhouensis]|uniref:ATP-binding protein n=1 Tax=Ferrovibrio xuzhouensis TaxID=1576914 RepID=A0ABV7VJW0_9PROT
MRFLILRILTHSELGVFHEYRRQGKEGSKQRAINFDWDVVDRVFPAAKDDDRIDMDLEYETDSGTGSARQWLKRQDKNWRLEGNCPTDKCYHFVEPGCLFAMEVDASKSPASGSWAVFSRSDDATRAILNDGESRGLAKSSMIALHDDEGRHIWEILSNARPKLFSFRGNGAKDMTGEIPSKGKKLDPNPARLVQILAAVGHTLPSAVADIVDNAITANATRIDITFGRPDTGHGRWMAIADNGTGMDEDTLAEAMRIGSALEYQSNSLGKYGYGLKGASWSQAKVFTVITKQEGKPVHHLTWDVNDMQDWTAKSDPLESWERDAAKLENHGTAVLWKNMKPPQTGPGLRGLDPFTGEILQLERHLELVFHRFLEGDAKGRQKVTIAINGKPIAPNNPVGHALVEPFDAKTIRVPTETEDGKVLVRANVLPSEEEVTKFHGADSEAAKRDLDRIGLYGKRNDTQGLFIYRHDRLIKWGGWHQMWETNDEKTKLARVIVDFDDVLDDAFKINISKQIVQLPQSLQIEVKKLSDVARKASQQKYRKPKQSSNPGPSAGSAGNRHVPGSSQPAQPRTLQTPTGSSPASASIPPSVSVTDVSTDKFLWKVSTGLTGLVDLQFSAVSTDLSGLIKQIQDDEIAVEYLTNFLRKLDDIGVQRLLLERKIA